MSFGTTAGTFVVGSPTDLPVRSGTEGSLGREVTAGRCADITVSAAAARGALLPTLNTDLVVRLGTGY